MSLKRLIMMLLALLWTMPRLYAGQVVASRAVVATGSREASLSALRILQQGGNAVDAAISAAFVLAVTEPHSSGLGGGGFALIYRAQSQQISALDFRERAPAAITPALYQNQTHQSASAPNSSRLGGLAVAVPGEVAGLFALHRTHGSLPMKTLLADAIRLAREGFVVPPKVAQSLAASSDDLARFESTVQTWQLPPQLPVKSLAQPQWPTLGTRWQQPDLARTLMALQTQGERAFYQGAIAARIATSVQVHGGVLSLSDLADYSVKWRAPLQGDYRGHTIYTMPLPSAGGLQLLQLLRATELSQPAPFKSPAMLHQSIEWMRRSYADRAAALGDPDVVKVATAELLSDAHIRGWLAAMNPAQATPSAALQVKAAPQKERMHTTHLSIIDAEGSAVSMTLTINGSFGSGLIAGGTGVMLNNEMDDFTTQLDQPNLYGLAPSAANLVAPFKRPLSSMAPTIVLQGGQLRYALGAPGGSTIVTTLFWTLIHAIDDHADLFRAIALPRLHQQWLPDVVRAERFALDALTEQALVKLGHHLEYREDWGNAQIVGVLPDGRKAAASDPRADGAALGF